MRLPRPSIRLRLTAWYAAIFMAMGTVLLGVCCAVVRHEFRDESGRVHVAVEELAPVKPGAPTIRVRIAPGIPLETPIPCGNSTPRRATSTGRRATPTQPRSAPPTTAR